MITEKQKKLIEKIHTKTAQDQLDWRDTAYESGYLISFPEHTVSITENRDFELSLSISNLDGKVIDIISEDDLDGEEKQYALYLKEIFEGARRKALNADQAIDTLLAALD